MALDEATTALVRQLVDAGVKPLHEMTAQEARAFVSSLRAQPSSVPQMVMTKDIRVSVTGGAITLRLLVPSDNPQGVIVYYHGGGWVVGSVDDSDLLGRRLAERADCAVVLVGYRLAPEYRFPTAVEDAYAALCWVDRRIEDIAKKRVPVLVAGDSAGGNLAAVVALLVRDRRGPAIAMQVLVYPVTDCDFDTTSYVDPENALLLSRDSMIWFWDHYAPDLQGRLAPEASPLQVPDVSNLPPAVVLTAEHDVLRAEGELYATRLIKAGVPVQHQRFAGQMHGFFTMVDVLPGSDAGIGYVADAVRRHLANHNERPPSTV